MFRTEDNSGLYQSEQRQAWHECGLPPLNDAEISSTVLFHEKASGAGPEAVLSMPVTPAVAEDEGGPLWPQLPREQMWSCGIVRAVLLC